MTDPDPILGGGRIIKAQCVSYHANLDLVFIRLELDPPGPQSAIYISPVPLPGREPQVGDSVWWTRDTAYCEWNGGETKLDMMWPPFDPATVRDEVITG